MMPTTRQLILNPEGQYSVLSIHKHNLILQCRILEPYYTNIVNEMDFKTRKSYSSFHKLSKIIMVSYF